MLSRGQLLEAGVARSTVDGSLRSLLFPVFPGVYAVGRPHIGQEGLWLAGVLAGGEGAALAGRSAAAAWGFMKARPGVDVVRRGPRLATRSLLGPDGTGRSVPLNIRRTRHLPDRDVRTIRGIPVASPARTLLDLAASLAPNAMKHAFIEADRLGLLVDEELEDCVARGRGHAGAALYRSLSSDRIPDIGRARSLLEGLLLDACRREGVEAPEVNVVIGGHEVDCVWRERRLAVELDSYGFHRGLENFEKDLARNNRLWADGWVLLRFTWRRLNREPEQVVQEVRSALASRG